MHELSLSQNIVRTVLNASGAEKNQICAIAIEVGALSAVNVSSLEFCMRLTLQQRGMEKTEVQITSIPARVRCECGLVYEPEDVFAPCPDCGSFERTVLEGTDVNIPYVEVEDEEG